MGSAEREGRRRQGGRTNVRRIDAANGDRFLDLEPREEREKRGKEKGRKETNP